MSENPYEPPQTAALSGVVTAQLIDDNDMWRLGKLLIVRKNAKFPNRCIKTNVPTTRRLKRKLVWHHWAYYLIILLNIIIYVVVALIVQKRATIYVGLSEQQIRKRRWIILTAWLSVFLGFGMIIIGILGSPNTTWSLVVFLTGIAVFFFGILFGLFGSRIVVPTRITDDYIWLKGACPEFLAELPVWPYPQ